MAEIKCAIPYKNKGYKKKYKIKQLKDLATTHTRKNHGMLKNLYCPTKGCPARVVLHIARTKEGSTYLCTWPGDHHSSNCIHKFNYIDAYKQSKKNDKNYYVDYPHLLKCMSYGFKTFINGRRRYPRNSNNNSKSRHHKSSNTNKRSHRSERPASLSRDLTRSTNKHIRHRRMRYYKPDTLKPTTFGKLLLRGYLSSIKFDKDGHLLLIVEHNNVQKDIVSKRHFFDHDYKLKNYLTENCSHLNDYLISHKILFGAFVNIILNRKYHKVILVRKSNDMFFNLNKNTKVFSKKSLRLLE